MRKTTTTDPIGESSLVEMESTFLQCPLSFEQMQDPVVVFPSGQSYDRKYICQSLLHYPNLDPKSGVYYDKPLRYTTNYALRAILQERRCFVPADDQGFEQAYEKAWREKIANSSSAATAQEPIDNANAAQIIQYNHRRTFQLRTRSFVCRVEQSFAIALMITILCMAVYARTAGDTVESQCKAIYITLSPAAAWYSY